MEQRRDAGAPGDALAGNALSAVMIAGTKGYAEEAQELVKRYESIPFAEKHQAVLRSNSRKLTAYGLS
jgi:hypothetical protein